MLFYDRGYNTNTKNVKLSNPNLSNPKSSVSRTPQLVSIFTTYLMQKKVLEPGTFVFRKPLYRIRKFLIYIRVTVTCKRQTQ